MDRDAKQFRVFYGEESSDPETDPPGKRRWTLSGQFLLVSGIAVALVGGLSRGPEGAIGGLFLAALFALGVASWMTVGPHRATRGAAQAVVFGAVCVTVALAGWLGLTSAGSERFEPLGFAMAIRESVLDPGLWVRIALLGMVVYLAWLGLRPNWPIEVAIDAERVMTFRGVPQAKQPAIKEFLERESWLKAPLQIKARRHTNGHWQFAFVGHIAWQDEQRLRNFLNSVM